MSDTANGKVVGKVKWFNDKKGFGFIEVQGSDDVFVHYRNIEGQDGFRTLQEGDQVELLVSKGPKGLQAEKVTIL